MQCSELFFNLQHWKSDICNINRCVISATAGINVFSQEILKKNNIVKQADDLFFIQRQYQNQPERLGPPTRGLLDFRTPQTHHNTDRLHTFVELGRLEFAMIKCKRKKSAQPKIFVFWEFAFQGGWTKDVGFTSGRDSRHRCKQRTC